MTINQTDASAALAAMRKPTEVPPVPAMRLGLQLRLRRNDGVADRHAGVPLPWRFLGFVPFFGVFPLMIRWQRRSTGRFINGYRRGRTR
jgi:hypothetical protein